MRRAVAVILLCSTLAFTGCSTSWISEAEQIISVLVPATTNLVTLVATLQGNVPAADLQTIQGAGVQAETDLQLVQSLIAQYQKADVAAQPGLANQIGAALAAVQSSLGGILPSLHIKDTATQAKVTAVVGLVLSEVQSMAAIVPVVTPAATQAARLAARPVKKQTPLTAAQFVNSYNAMMTAKTGNPEAGSFDRRIANSCARQA